jgi:hypothetical protein
MPDAVRHVRVSVRLKNRFSEYICKTVKSNKKKQPNLSPMGESVSGAGFRSDDHVALLAFVAVRSLHEQLQRKEERLLTEIKSYYDADNITVPRSIYE